MSEPEFKSVRYEKVTLICATETFKDINDPKNDSKATDYIDVGASNCVILEASSVELHFLETDIVHLYKPDMESLESEVK